MTIFSTACTVVYVLVDLLGLPLYGPYILMLVQMVVELAAQPEMDLVMGIHHVANLGVTVLFLVAPAFDVVIRTGLKVEIPTLLRLVQRALGKRAPRALAFTFFATFYLTRFFFGWRWLVDADFVWEHTELRPYVGEALAIPLRRFGYVCLLVIHGCGLWWGGLLWGILTHTLRKDAMLPRAETFGMMPSLFVTFLVGSWPTKVSQVLLTLTTFTFHSCPPTGKPRLLATLKFCDLCAMVAAMFCHVAAAGGGNGRTLALHVAALGLCLVGVREWKAHANGPVVANILGPLSLFNCAFCAPYAQLFYLATPWLLAMCCIITLRKRGLSHYTAITMHVFNSWMVYNSCVAAQLVTGSGGAAKNIFQHWLDL